MYGGAMVLLNVGFRLVPLLIIMAGCLVFLRRAKSVAGILLLVSNVCVVAIGLLTAIVSVAMIRGALKPEAFAQHSWSLSVAGSAASLAFSIGFLWMALDTKRKVE